MSFEESIDDQLDIRGLKWDINLIFELLGMSRNCNLLHNTQNYQLCHTINKLDQFILKLRFYFYSTVSWDVK